jgi:hypothetical protein
MATSESAVPTRLRLSGGTVTGTEQQARFVDVRAGVEHEELRGQPRNRLESGVVRDDREGRRRAEAVAHDVTHDHARRRQEQLRDRPDAAFGR